MAWYWIILICILAILFLYFILCLIVSRSMPEKVLKPKGERHRSYELVRQEQTERGHVDYEAYDRMEKEPFLLHSNGEDISGEFIPARVSPVSGERPKCLIRVHGYTQNRMLSVRFIPMFQALGYAAVIYDQRAFGNSTGEISSMGSYEKFDLSAVITWVKQRMGEDTIIGIHGESLGAITAMETLAIDNRIDFIVEDGGGTDLYHMMKFFLKLLHLPPFPAVLMISRRIKHLLGFDCKDVSPISRVSETNVPIMFIHGTSDEQVPVEMCTKLFREAKNPLSRMELFEGAMHCQGHAQEPERYEKVVQQFVRDVEAALK